MPPKTLVLGLNSGEGLQQQQGHLSELPCPADWQNRSPWRWHQACRECCFMTCLFVGVALCFYASSSWLGYEWSCTCTCTVSVDITIVSPMHIINAFLWLTLASVFLPCVFFWRKLFDWIHHPEVKFQLSITCRTSLLERAEQFVLHMSEQIVPRLCKVCAHLSLLTNVKAEKHPASFAFPS